MKTVIATLTLVALTVGCAHSGGPEASKGAREQAARDETRLAEALAGRVAGPPQDCISLRDLGGNRSFGRGVILFGDSIDEVVYVNRPPVGCNELGLGRALKIRSTTMQLCRADIVTVIDPVSGMEVGGCSLGEFTPYRRAEAAKSK